MLSNEGLAIDPLIAAIERYMREQECQPEVLIVSPECVEIAHFILKADAPMWWVDIEKAYVGDRISYIAKLEYIRSVLVEYNIDYALEKDDWFLGEKVEYTYC